VLGAGPIGLLGAVLTRTLGLETTLWSRRIGDGRRAWLERIGAGAVPSSEASLPDLAKRLSPVDLVLECTGAPPVIRDALLSLGPNGVLCLLGVSAGEGPAEVPVARWNLQAVLGNQVVFGCVNAHRRDFEAGARHMAAWARRWPGLLEALVTRQVPPEHFQAAVARQPDDVKTVVRFAE
jgi:threonine dehydrogenase-like Zn-dependent dehydrogenase